MILQTEVSEQFPQGQMVIPFEGLKDMNEVPWKKTSGLNISEILPYVIVERAISLEPLSVVIVNIKVNGSIRRYKIPVYRDGLINDKKVELESPE